MESNKIKQGDIFKVKLNSKNFGYIQFIRRTDFLGSDLIRIFDLTSNECNIPSLDSIIGSNIILYTHTLLKIGIKLNEISKVYNFPIEKTFQEPRFRSIQYDIINNEKIPKYLIYCNDKFIDVSKDYKDFNQIPNRVFYQINHIKKIIEMGFDPSSHLL